MSTTFGAYLRQERRRRGWSQLTLAEKARIHWKTVDRLEHGRNVPDVDTVHRLAAALELPFDDLESLVVRRVVPEPKPNLPRRGGKPKGAFGEELYRLRRERGWSQGDLAQKVGVTHQAASHWEKGRWTPTVNTITLLAAALEVSVDSLESLLVRRAVPEPMPEEPRPSRFTDSEIEAIVALWLAGEMRIKDIAREFCLREQSDIQEVVQRYFDLPILPRGQSHDRAALALRFEERTGERIVFQGTSRLRVKPDVRREILRLYRESDLTVSQIARQVGCNMGTLQAIVAEAFGPVGRGSNGRRIRARRGVAA